MTKYLPLLSTIIITAAAAISAPGQAFLTSHPTVALLLVLVSQALHAALPSVFKS